MLPRFAHVEDEFERAIQKVIRRATKGKGLLSEIKSHVVHEGKIMSVVRGAEEEEITNMRAAQADVSMSYDEVDNVNLDFIMAKVNEIATQFETQFSERLFDLMKDVTNRTGQTVDASGKPLSNELILKMFDKIQIEFERNKEIGDVTIVTSPAMVPIFQRLEAEVKNSPELQRKWNDLIERKRNEFREREIDRNLAG
jgi:hypothetical protein